MTDLLTEIWRIAPEHFHTMIDAGIFAEDEQVELLEGVLIKKHRQTPQHAYVRRQLREQLQKFDIPSFFATSVFWLTTNDSQTNPDGLLVKNIPASYWSRHPTASDVALLVEVADTTLERDQTWKKRIYAHAGIPIYWLINLPQRQIEVYTIPIAGLDLTYARREIYSENDNVPIVIDGDVVATMLVSDLLPPSNV